MGQPRFLIIGAGVVGSSLADELTALGHRDVTVLDRGPLVPGTTAMTGGSSSHAPGLVFQTNASPTMTGFAQYTAQKFGSLNQPGSLSFNAVGGLEVATTPQRLAELARKEGWAKVAGIPAELLTPAECVALHPLLDRGLVLGGLHTPTDGLAGAPAAITAQMNRAIERGAVFIGDQVVVEVLRRGGSVTGVRTADRVFRADVVISCAGFWGAQLGELVDLVVPLVPMGHQYAKTSAIESLSALPDSGRGHADAALPILRHQDADLYYRQHGNQIGIGYYGHRPMPVDMNRLYEATADESMPSMLPFTAADFDPAWAETARMLPDVASAEVVDGFNGIFSFTPDGGPMMGEHPGLDGFWVAEAVWVTHSAGVAKTMAHWITQGTPDVDLHGCDLARFTDAQLRPDYVADTSAQGFVEVYDIIHPREPRSVQRGIAASPFHARQVAAGAVFHVGRQWERPAWYESNAHLVDARHHYPADEWARRHWSPIVLAEAAATRERVGLYDMTSLMRIEVTGPDAATFLSRLLTRNVDRPIGTVVYALLLDARGGVRSDVTVARLGDDRFQLGINGPMDIDWLRRRRDAEAVTITDITAVTCCIGVWGPRARDLVAPLCSIDLRDNTLGYYKAAEATIAGIAVTMLRISYVGELGWEIYAGNADGQQLWDRLAEAGKTVGAVLAGRSALDVLRIEKGYRSWGHDVNAEMTPDEAGIGFAVGKKHDFFGREALLERPIRCRLQTVVADDPAAVVLGGEPVLVDTEVVGHVTSAAFSPTVGRTIAYVKVRPDVDIGEHVSIEYFGRTLDFTVTDPVLVDPAGDRVKGLIGVVG
ncbi:FAD-dependent oxidoreductase [Williamsia sp. 1135]|uniref:GcvT family protein n=1 Tax=Williamsia sp. 1135 TaxID=1889262 RepID=UPI000A11015B|nr:FAD-dependent oxidoreductase [Williamsia sp. 1135]ORM23928.1 sarcosine dehydrogenase [Williamsia sp. 1135]